MGQLLITETNRTTEVVAASESGNSKFNYLIRYKIINMNLTELTVSVAPKQVLTTPTAEQQQQQQQPQQPQSASVGAVSFINGNMGVSLSLSLDEDDNFGIIMNARAIYKQVKDELAS